MARLAPMLIAAVLAAQPCAAEAPVAARTVKAGALLSADDVAAADVTSAEALALIGREARATVYAGRPLRSSDFGAPTLVTRNRIVTIHYTSSGLTISAEGRALGQGGAGDRLSVLNTGSRTTVSGLIQPDGSVAVGQTP